MKRALLSILMFLGVGTAVLFAAITIPEALVRYRTTITLNVDGKTVTGSGVSQVAYFKNIRFGGASASTRADVKGVAIPIIIAENEVILVLMVRGESPFSESAALIPVLFGISGGGVAAKDLYKINTVSGTREVSQALLRPAARITDIREPKSAVFIPLYNAQEASARGVSVQRVTIEIVDPGIWPFNLFGQTGEPISAAPIKTIPWVGNQQQLSELYTALVATGGNWGSIETRALVREGM